MWLNVVVLRSVRLLAGGCRGVLAWCSCPYVAGARAFGFLVALFPFPGDVPGKRSLPTYGGGRRIPAPGREGRRENLYFQVSPYSGRSMFLDFGSLHQKHRVGGTLGGVLHDGSDGWRSPVTQGDNTGGRGHLPPPPTIVSCPADRSRTSWWILFPAHHDGFFRVLGLRFALPQGVAAPLWPAVAAATNSTKDVAASLPPTVAAAVHSSGQQCHFCTVLMSPSVVQFAGPIGREWQSLE